MVVEGYEGERLVRVEVRDLGVFNMQGLNVQLRSYYYYFF